MGSSNRRTLQPIEKQDVEMMEERESLERQCRLYKEWERED